MSSTPELRIAIGTFKSDIGGSRGDEAGWLVTDRGERIRVTARTLERCCCWLACRGERAIVTAKLVAWTVGDQGRPYYVAASVGMLTGAVRHHTGGDGGGNAA